MSTPGAPPERSTTEEAVRATTAAVVSAIIELMRALREEVERIQRSGEAFVGRVKGAIVRSLQALQRALVETLLAGLFVVLGVIVLSVFLVAVLNKYLGDPWGTGLTALILLAFAGLFYLRARASFRVMEREAQALITGQGRT
jgi:hypothetical protein